MAGWALRVSDRAASPDSRSSITSQPRISDPRTNGQPAGSPAQGAPLLLAMRPWPGKVKAILSTAKASYGEEVTNNQPMVLTLCRPPRLPLTATSFRLARRTRARPPSRPRRAAALRRLRQPDPVRRGRQPAHHRFLALHGGPRAHRGGRARPGRPGRGGPLPLVRTGGGRRGGPGARRADPVRPGSEPLPEAPEPLP